jgi:hypothetical protein
LFLSYAQLTDGCLSFPLIPDFSPPVSGVLPVAGIVSNFHGVSPLPTLSPVAIFTPTPTVIPQPSSNSTDPIIHCKVLSCGYLDVPQSVCKYAGCCQIGNNNIPYSDHNKCIQDQNAYYSSQQNLTTQHPQANSQNNQPTYPVANMAPYNSCSSQVQSILSSCDSTCTAVNSSDDSYCMTAYGYHGIYADTDKYSACLSDATAKQKACLDTCSSNQQSGLQNCDKLTK